MKMNIEWNNWAVDSGQCSVVSAQWSARNRKRFRPALIPHPSSLIPHPSSRAFTLIEVLLTLCLLVIMGTMAWPQLDKAFSNHRLRKAADIVRIQWCKARVEAMSTGTMRIFRYEIEGNHFRLEGSTDTTITDPAATDPLQIIIADQARSRQNNANPGVTAGYGDKILPEDIVFVTGQTEIDANTAMMANNMSAAVNPATGAAGNAVSGAGWSEPIIFYPDGTASSARLMLRNQIGRSIELELRGLTGVVKVGEITSASQRGKL